MEDTVKDTRPYRMKLREEQGQLTRQRILEAARGLLVTRGYGRVTMHDVAREAGVAYQTVYAQFGTKLQMAMAVCDADLGHVGDALALVGRGADDAEPRGWLRTLAVVARRLYEPCAEVLRFMRESGDPDLAGRFKEIERSRLQLVEPLRQWIDRVPENERAVTGPEAADVVWALAGPETYEQLVLDRGWTPDRYERWLAGALVDLVFGTAP